MYRPFRPFRFPCRIAGAFDPGKGYASPSGLIHGAQTLSQFTLECKEICDHV